MATALSRVPFSLSAQEAVAGLRAARERTLSLVSGITDEDLERVHSPLMSPLVWDLAHIAAYEDLWLVHRHGGLPLLRADLAGLYDAFETPRIRRGEVAKLGPDEAYEYLAQVRARALEVVEGQGVADGEVHEMVIQHEAQHNETMLQTIVLARLQAPRTGGASRPASGSHGSGVEPVDESTGLEPVDEGTGLELIDVPAGPFELGAVGDRFSYDNERPAHVVELPPYRIGRTPVTNGAWLAWMRSGGYERSDCWSAAGWELRQREALEHPGGWEKSRVEPEGYREWGPAGWRPLVLDHPVAHISWFEADAFARAHGLRMPTEAEWEKAASHDPVGGRKLAWPWGEDPGCAGRANLIDSGIGGSAPVGTYPDGASPAGALGMLGDVWEWTGTDFHGYPGFCAHPYREYSEVFFERGYKVLRGGSWASGERVVTPTFRNWDLPQRRQVFAGLRLAQDAR